jgi:hypothetical protein
VRFIHDMRICALCGGISDCHTVLATALSWHPGNCEAAFREAATVLRCTYHVHDCLCVELYNVHVQVKCAIFIRGLEFPPVRVITKILATFGSETFARL